jgi:plasmid stabilization system protein ParE
VDYEVVISPLARRDLQGIVRYISLDASERAKTFGELLLAKTRSLAEFPEQGHIVLEFNDPAIRELIHGRYRIIYRVTHAARKVAVVRIWHGSRGTPVLKAIRPPL